MKHRIGFGIFLTLVIGSVLAAIVAGFLHSGTPGEERIRRFDQQRASDLQQISYAVDQYWMTRDKLPPSLKELGGERDFYLPSMADPQDGTPYEYRIVSPEGRYELCATFEATQDDASYAAPGRIGANPSFWNHGIGRTCFQFTVPPRPPVR